MKNLFLLSSLLLLSLTNLTNSNPLLIKDNKELVFENKTNENNNLNCLKLGEVCKTQSDCCAHYCYCDEKKLESLCKCEKDPHCIPI